VIKEMESFFFPALLCVYTIMPVVLRFNEPVLEPLPSLSSFGDFP